MQEQAHSLAEAVSVFRLAQGAPAPAPARRAVPAPVRALPAAAAAPATATATARSARRPAPGGMARPAVAAGADDGWETF
jgi:methyl-accepting chemotaxis protein